MEAALASGFRRLAVDVIRALGAALGGAIAGQGDTAVAELAPATGFQL